MNMKSMGLAVLMLCIAGAFAMADEGIVKEEFIYLEAPFPSCHASTIEEVDDGVLVAAWFGGTHERHDDVGIWVSRNEGDGWSEPVEVVAVEDEPTWNPVLFKMPEGELILFYKAGPSPQTWTGLLKRSNDGGKTWSEPEMLPAGILGPIKNKPIMHEGKLICGSSVESWNAWACWMEITPDGGKTWDKYGPIAYPGVSKGLIQPTLFFDDDGNLRMLCRAANVGYICTAVSEDDGKTWSTPEKTNLPHNNSGIDAVRLDDGHIVLVYNHTQRGRSPLNVAVSDDGGDSWKQVATLEDQPGEYSYPAIIQTDDGMLHTTYTWKRERIKHVVLDPSKW